MRRFTEPTARNLLRTTLVLGTPPLGLAALAFGVLGVSFLGGNSAFSNSAAIGLGFLGYITLRLLTRYAKPGWEESLVWFLETRVQQKPKGGSVERDPNNLEIHPPDTLDELQLVRIKEALRDPIAAIKPGERKAYWLFKDEAGSELFRTNPKGKYQLKGKHKSDPEASKRYVYSLFRLPVSLDPLWLFSIISRIQCDYQMSVRLDGLDPATAKRRIEVARKNNAHGDEGLLDIDASVAFDESSAVLTQLSRGEESLVELSLVISSKCPLDLDDQYFCLEKHPLLALMSSDGTRKRTHRSHVVRVTTACDLIPNIGDPAEKSPHILTTRRGLPLYFDPTDSRLEALHWLVVGASGSGKSFFTGLMLKRMWDQECPISILFIDHNRSFKRLVRSARTTYFEPSNEAELEEAMMVLTKQLGNSGAMIGIELSELRGTSKKHAMARILSGVEGFLRSRYSTQPVYVVLDECWSFMRHEPELVEQAFREFRKLSGAMIAITQSLSDFLTDEAGQTIFQNAPVRVLLRQGEDISPFQRMLGLNSVELDRVRELRQERGKFAECLIKTPFLSRIGRLYPTDLEHDLLRTDNLREEWVAEARNRLTLVDGGAERS